MYRYSTLLIITEGEVWKVAVTWAKRVFTPASSRTRQKGNFRPAECYWSIKAIAHASRKQRNLHYKENGCFSYCFRNLRHNVVSVILSEKVTKITAVLNFASELYDITELRCEIGTCQGDNGMPSKMAGCSLPYSVYDNCLCSRMNRYRLQEYPTSEMHFSSLYNKWKKSEEICNIR
jgi:hypothetical protein